jgi:ABC-type glycerol-3-phosphate transport system substrate-binding protein
MASSKYTRRDFLRLSAGGAGGLFLAANGMSPRRAFAHGLYQGDVVNLNAYVHNDHPWALVKPSFEAKFPNIKLNLLAEATAGTEDKSFRAILSAGESNPADVPDLFWPEPFEVQELGRAGVLLDTSALMEKYKSDLVPGKVTECFIPSTGKYAAVPGAISVAVLFYRQDIWEKAGVTIPDDWTWDDFIEASMKIKRDTGAYTLHMATDGNQWSGVVFSFILAQLGGSFTNADGTQVTLDDEKGVAAMQLVKKMYDAGIAIDDYLFSETFIAAAKSGKIAAGPFPDWYRGYGLGNSLKTPEDGLGKWRIALLPRAEKGGIRTANLGGANTASTIYTTHPDEVLKFMEYTHMSLEGADLMGTFGNIPPYLPYQKTEAWQSKRSPVFGDFAFTKVLGEAVQQYPTTWYKLPVWSEAFTQVGAQLPRILKGEIGVEEGVKALGETVRRLNERYQG